MDSVVRGNSYASGQLTGHINLRNTSSSSKDYYARRAKVGSSAVVDSNYFCWDLSFAAVVHQPNVMSHRHRILSFAAKHQQIISVCNAVTR